MIVTDIWAKGLEHYEFNKNILKILEKISKNEIKYLGEKEQVKDLKKETKNIEYLSLNLGQEKKGKKLLKLIKNLLEIKKIEEKKIVILASNPSIMFFSKLILKKRKIYFIFHSLEMLNDKKKGSYKYLRFIIEFKKNKNNFKYIVLGENIKKNLEKKFPALKEKICFIDHPCSFNEEKEKEKEKSDLKIATIGITSLKKGLENIYEFIEKNKNKFEYKHIGKVIGDISKKYLNYFYMTEELISKEKFENEILEQDYILILYPKNSYKLTASGVYFDCIKYNKPLLALRNEYFEYMFKKYGEIGILFENIDDLIRYLSQDRVKLKEEKEKYKKNIKRIKSLLNIEVEKQLREILGEDE